MKHLSQKLLLISSVITFLLFAAASWYGWQSVRRQLLLMEMRNYYDIGHKAVLQHDYVKAKNNYQAAIICWEQASRMPGFLSVENASYDGYLTAGNSYRKMLRMLQARDCYKEGLRYDPNSINLLTAAGALAYEMGDYDRARCLLEKSNRIYPLQKPWRLKLEKLQALAKNSGKKGEGP